MEASKNVRISSICQDFFPYKYCLGMSSSSAEANENTRSSISNPAEAFTDNGDILNIVDVAVLIVSFYRSMWQSSHR